MKVKYYIPTSLQHLTPNIVRQIALIGLIIAFMAISAHAMKQPSEYDANECELIAKDFQKEYGGSLVWVQPLKSSGAYDLGEYNAHIMNRMFIEGKLQYYDYATHTTMESKDDVLKWYGKPAIVYDLSKERPEFSMIWHY